MPVRRNTIHPSGAETASFNSVAMETMASEMIVGVDVTASSGTSPTLDLEIEYSPDGTNWVSAASAHTFTQFTTTGTQSKRFSPEGAYYRLKATIGGTSPSFTFVVIGAHLDVR